MKYQQALYWFTNDLRLTNNSLLAQMANEAERVCFVYIKNDSEFTHPMFQDRGVGERRQRFIDDSLQDLADQLANQGHQLAVFSGTPQKVITEIVQTLEVNAIYVCEQTGLDEAQQVSDLVLKLPHVTFEQNKQQLLFDLTAHLDDSRIFNTFTSFRKYCEQSHHSVHTDHNLIKVLPYPCSESKLKLLSQVPGYQHQSGKNYQDRPYIQAGELAATVHLASYFRSINPSTYKETRNALDDWHSSTKFSPYLANGNLSVKAVWHEVERYEALNGSNDSTYWIKFELLWREFFHWLAIKSGASLFKFEGQRSKGPLTSFYPERFNKWISGATPYPIVNACMKQLQATGYMSNRGRQLVASCFVNELSLDWRYGAAYFQQQLVDYDVAANWGNWQYIAGVGADPRGGRQFNLEKQAQQYDPNGAFVSKWTEPTDEQLDSIDMVDWPLAKEKTS